MSIKRGPEFSEWIGWSKQKHGVLFASSTNWPSFWGTKRIAVLIRGDSRSFFPPLTARVTSIDLLQKNGTCCVFLTLHHWTAMENGKCGLKKASATVLWKKSALTECYSSDPFFLMHLFFRKQKWLLNLCITQVLVAFCFQSPERFFCVALWSSCS